MKYYSEEKVEDIIYKFLLKEIEDCESHVYASHLEEFNNYNDPHEKLKRRIKNFTKGFRDG